MGSDAEQAAARPVAILTQFVFRLAFGLALAMSITPARLVPSGFYRVHLYVLLGLNVLATLVATTSGEDQIDLVPPVAGALLSYAGAVAWLYEKPKAGKLFLVAVTVTSLWGAWLPLGKLSLLRAGAGQTFVAWCLEWIDAPTAGLLLGASMASMLLGHWYLNTPTMDLIPLRRLVILLAAAAVLRGIVCAAGLGFEIAAVGTLRFEQVLFLALRWLAGIFGILGLAWMSWQTLKIPNTQSATGILYVTVIGTFVGELTSQLLSARAGYPL
ncbi:MAG: hypothetical protein KF708_04610 [Pirellulales bacterium]|nr:hypothetical protein [Pirellulales bacterium]